MLRKVLTRLAVWVSALGLAPLALGTGIPVVDAMLNSTAAVQLHQQITTATQKCSANAQADRPVCPASAAV